MRCPQSPNLSDLDRGEVLDGLVHVVDAVVDQHVGESHEPDTSEQKKKVERTNKNRHTIERTNEIVGQPKENSERTNELMEPSNEVMEQANETVELLTGIVAQTKENSKV